MVTYTAASAIWCPYSGFHNSAPVAGSGEFARDASLWSSGPDEVVFNSTPQFGLGTYSGSIDASGSSSGTPDRLTMEVGGHTYQWRRVRIYNGPMTGLSAIALDELGRPVDGTLLEFRAADGVVSNGVTNNQNEFGTGVPPGLTVRVFIRPPVGYSVQQGQDNPVVVTAGQVTRVTIQPKKS